jgi:FkbM family methyltransferase
MLKALAARLPEQIQNQLKRRHFRRLIRNGDFTSDEPEFFQLHEMIHPGDIAIDAGANVGAYTRRLAEIVGSEGRVISFEPVAETFELLSANTVDLGNVTLMNAALSHKMHWVSMDVPKVSGMSNFYQATISDSGKRRSLAMPLDSFDLDRVALMKIDVEGHELSVLEGAAHLISRCHPTIIIETSPNSAACQWLQRAGYRIDRRHDSPNCVAR